MMKLNIACLCLATLLLAGCGSSNNDTAASNTDVKQSGSPVIHQENDHTGHDHEQHAHEVDAQQHETTTQEEQTIMVKVHVFNAAGELVGPVESPKVVKTEEEWKAQLTDEQYRITRRAGTEPAFCGTLLDNKKEGVYSCICCNLPLFSSDAKFKSGTGWPSFFQPIAEGNVGEHLDTKFGMIRTEIVCNRCDAHLGHVFNDGPRPTGMRFCLNSESLTFTEKKDLATLADPASANVVEETESVAKDE